MTETLNVQPSTQPPMSPERAKWIIIAAAIYLALPIDIIPIVGLVGDLGALFVALNAVKSSSSSPRQGD